MTGPPNPLAVALCVIAAGLVALALGAWWQRERTRGTRSFTFLALAAAVWSLAEGARAWAVDPFARLTWLQVEVLGVAALPVALLVFAQDYARRTDRFDRYAVAALLVLPAVGLGLAWTYPLQGGFWSTVEAVGPQLVPQPGPWWWVHAVYGYGIAAAATALLVGTWRRTRHRFRRPTAWLLGGVAAAWAAHGASAMVGSRLAVDLTPVGFAVAGLAAVVGLLAHRPRDVLPVARETVLGQLPDPVLVFDPWRRVLRANGAAATLFEAGHPEDLVGRSAAELLHDQPGLLRAVGIEASVELDVRWAREPAEQHFRARVTPLADRRGRHGGQLLYLQDVGHEVRSDHERRATERQLEAHRSHLLALQQVLQALAAGRPTEAWSESLVQRGGEALRAPHAALFRLAPDGDSLERAAAIGGFAEGAAVRVRRGEDLLGRAWVEGRPVATPDYPSSRGRAGGRDVAWARAALAVPCVGPDGAVGALAFARARDDRAPFSAADEAFATALARLAAVATDGSDRADTAARARRELDALDGALAALSEPTPQPEALTRTLAAAREAIGFGRAVAWLPTVDGTALRVAASIGLGPDAAAAAAEPVPLDGSVPVLEAAYRRAEEVVLEPPAPVPARWRARGPAAASRLLRSRAPVALPLLARGRTLGVLAVDDPYERAPLGRAVADLRRFAALAALAVDADRGGVAPAPPVAGTGSLRPPDDDAPVPPPERWGPLSLADVALEAARRVRPRFARRPGVALDLDLPHGLPPVAGDRERLVRVVMHLLARAWATTRTGSVSLTLARDHDPVLGEAQVLRVRDTGPGEEEAALEALFEGVGPFPACRRSVERHGGRLWVRSAPGAGATVGVVLPVAGGGAASATDARTGATSVAGTAPERW